MSKLKEGWGIVRPGDKKAHYYVDSESLCRRIMFYFGPLYADEGRREDDCAACRKKLEKRT